MCTDLHAEAVQTGGAPAQVTHSNVRIDVCWQLLNQLFCLFMQLVKPSIGSSDKTTLRAASIHKGLQLTGCRHLLMCSEEGNHLLIIRACSRLGIYTQHTVMFGAITMTFSLDDGQALLVLCYPGSCTTVNKALTYCNTL